MLRGHLASLLLELSLRCGSQGNYSHVTLLLCKMEPYLPSEQSLAWGQYQKRAACGAIAR